MATSTPSIHLRRPPAWFFKFPPDAQPLALPPPTDARTFAAPFGIPTDIYNGALDYKVPITIATLYAVTAIVWNRINRSREYKPYAFSKTRAFKAFVILHNVFLAVFSAFTFFGMLRALAHTWPGREHHLLGKYWPGLRVEYSLAGAADALCKMHGPRGYGQFVAFRPDSLLWQAQDKTVQLLETGYPDGSDVGRLWNEGLAFWGWWFYLSKFYEVFDTFIILAKGKRSSTLQTYHHTGAMMCMWAGIRYMSPPIWMFCFLNSGIHAMMYTYYTLSALHIRVPTRIKRSLTTMQIGQFLIGITFASLHLFVTYDIPLTKAEAVSKTLEAMASSVVSGVSAATSAGLAVWLKQAALRAAGEEGLAENVLAPPAQAVYKKLSEEYRPEQQSYGTGFETVPCIDTSGQSFAIWLNLAYLAPLTGLFVRFFVKSYMRRGAASRQGPGGKKHQAIEAAKDAAHGTERKVDEFGKSIEKSVDDIAKEVNGKANDKANGNGTPRSRKVSGTIKREWERFEKGGEQVADAAKSGKAGLRKKVSEGHDKLRRMFEEGSISERSKSPSSVQEGQEEQEEQRGRTMSDASSAAKEYISETKEAAEKKIEELVESAKEAVSSAEKPSQESSTSEEQASSPTQDEPKKPNELEQSWADVAKDTYPKPSSSTTTTTTNETPSEEPATSDASQQDTERSETPTPHLSKQRSLSPQKSKLPRPTSRTRSPVNKDKKSAIPRPAANSSNGTKPTLSSSNSGGSSSSDRDKDNDNDKDAKSKSKSKSESESNPEPEPEPGKAEVQSSALPLSPAAPNAAAAAASDAKAEPDASPTPPTSTEDRDVPGEEEQDTNGESTQDQDRARSNSASNKENTEVEAPSEQGSKGSEALRFRHVSDGVEEAEVKEGVSFAQAVKAEGAEKKEGEEAGEGEGDISID